MESFKIKLDIYKARIKHDIAQIGHFKTMMMIMTGKAQSLLSLFTRGPFIIIFMSLILIITVSIHIAFGLHLDNLIYR